MRRPARRARRTSARIYTSLVTNAQIDRLPRLASITGLRWWAAFAVFFFHFRNLAPLPEPLSVFAPFGNLGVTFFFVLSGFVLTWSWNPATTLRTFYWRRFARIYPLAMVTLVLAIPVFYSFAPDPEQPWVKPVNIGILVLCVLLLQGWSRSPEIMFAGNPAAWTLTSEMFFYALHPWISRGLRRLAVHGALIAAVIVITVALVVRAYATAEPNSWIAGLPWPILRIYEFLFGMCLAWAFRRGWRPRTPVYVAYLLLILWAVTLLVLPRVDALAPIAAIFSPFALEGSAVVCGLLIVTSAARELRGTKGWSGTRPVVALGEWSYAFYLIHATILYTALALFGHQHGGWTSVAWLVGTLALSIVAAAALHLWVERPMEKRMRAWDDRRRVSSPDPAARR